jgi:glycerol uptake facilitator protein
MNAYLAEFVGTTLLVLLGDAVVANVVLAKTKGSGGGGGGAWIVITFGWAMAVSAFLKKRAPRFAG